MIITLQVEYTDGTTVDTEASTAEILDYEDHWERSFLAALDDLRANDLYWLAWRSLARKGETDLDYRAWADTTVANVKWLTEKAVTPRPLARKARRTSTS